MRYVSVYLTFSCDKHSSGPSFFTHKKTNYNGRLHGFVEKMWTRHVDHLYCIRQSKTLNVSLINYPGFYFWYVDLLIEEKVLTN